MYNGGKKNSSVGNSTNKIPIVVLASIVGLVQVFLRDYSSTSGWGPGLDDSWPRSGKEQPDAGRPQTSWRHSCGAKLPDCVLPPHTQRWKHAN